MKPEEMTNRPGEVKLKLFAIERLLAQIQAIENSLLTPDINGKLPGEYE